MGIIFLSLIQFYSSSGINLVGAHPTEVLNVLEKL